MKEKIKRFDFVKGTSSKTGRPYYRVDIYFNTVDGGEFKKSFFMKPIEVSFCGLKDLFH